MLVVGSAPSPGKGEGAAHQRGGGHGTAKSPSHYCWRWWYGCSWLPVEMDGFDRLMEG